MKIVKFAGENFKRLRAVEITPDGNIVPISGRNAQGKTSVLDAIWCTVGGRTAAKDTPRPVRDGEESATVQLDLGDIIVTRTWDAGGKTALKVTSPDGARFSSPQKVLDDLVGKLAFDPLAFAALPEKNQRRELLDLVELPFDIDQLDAEREAIFNQRTDVNREVKRLRAVVDDMPNPADVPDEPVDVASLMAELKAAQEAEVARQFAADEATRIDQRIAEIRQQIVELNQQLDGLLDRKAELAADDNLDPFAAIPDIAAIEARIASADEVNESVRQADARQRAVADLDAQTAHADELTAKLAAIDKAKADGLAAANMPIEGLSVDDDGVTYQGVPFSQASAAERLRVSMAIAMAANPGLRVIRITDGSLLDSENLALIETMAAEGDYQVWIEVVDETGEVGVMIEDGAVAS